MLMIYAFHASWCQPWVGMGLSFKVTVTLYERQGVSHHKPFDCLLDNKEDIKTSVHNNRHYNDDNISFVKVDDIVMTSWHGTKRCPQHWSLVRGIRWSPVDSPHKSPVMRKTFLLYGVDIPFPSSKLIDRTKCAVSLKCNFVLWS